MRHTKIICTVGPATESAEMLRKLVEAGTDVFRLNFSHGTVSGHQSIMRRGGGLKLASIYSGRRGHAAASAGQGDISFEVRPILDRNGFRSV